MNSQEIIELQNYLFISFITKFTIMRATFQLAPTHSYDVEPNMIFEY